MESWRLMIAELLTAALVIITGFYAWVTLRILRANEKVVGVMHEQAIAISRPYVVVAPFYEMDNPIFYLRIANLGKTAAINLRLTIDKSFFKSGEDRDLATFMAFNQPIDSFPPGGEIIFSLAQASKVFAASTEDPKLPHTFSVTAEYGFEGNRVKEVNRIDLRPYIGAQIPQNAYIRKLEKMSESLKNIAANTSKAPKPSENEQPS
jgi:hypothetical protein